MEHNRSWGNPYKHYQNFTRITLSLICLGLFVSVWGVWEYCRDARVDNLAEQVLLRETAAYYNWNRDAVPVYGVSSVVTGATVTCAKGLRVAHLGGWGGSVAGCLETGVAKLEKDCKDQKATVLATAATDGDFVHWKSATEHFCLSEAPAGVVAGKAWSAAVGDTAGGKCPTGFAVQCSTCQCTDSVVGDYSKCPVNQYTVAGVNAWYTAQHLTKKAGKAQPLVQLEGTLYGDACVLVSNHAKPLTTVKQWPLDAVVRTGCVTKVASSLGGAQTQAGSAWLTANKDVSASVKKADFAALETKGHLDTDTNTASGVVAHLNLRTKVETKCSVACSGFRFDLTLPERHVGVWDNVKVLCWVVGWGTLVAFVLLLWVVLVTKPRTQGAYLFVVVWTLVVYLVVVVLLWLAVFDAGEVQELNAAAVTAESDKCLVTKEWVDSKFLNSWNTVMDLSSLHSWLGWLTGLFTILWVVGLVLLLWNLSKLGRLRYEQVGSEGSELEDLEN